MAHYKIKREFIKYVKKRAIVKNVPYPEWYFQMLATAT